MSAAAEDDRRVDDRAGAARRGRAYDILVGRGLLAEAGARIAALGARAAADRHRRHRRAALRRGALAASLEAQGLRAAIDHRRAGRGLEILCRRSSGSATRSSRRRSSAAISSSRSAAASSATSRASPPRSCGAACASCRCRRRCSPRSIPRSAARPASTRRHGKNLVGAFHQPSLVLADTAAPRHPAAARDARRLCRGGEIRPDRRCRLLRLVRGELARRLRRRPGARRGRGAELPRQGRGRGARRARDGRPRAAQSRPHLRPRARADHRLRRRPPRPWRGRRHRPVPRLPLLGAARARARRQDAARVEAHLAPVGLPTRSADVPGGCGSVDALARRHGAGQEGEGRRADLHPRPRHRPELHRARRRRSRQVRAFLAERDADSVATP